MESQETKEPVPARLAAIVARLDAMDKAVAILSEYPTEVDKQVGALRDIIEQRFKYVEDSIAAAVTERGPLVVMFHESITKVAVLSARVDDIKEQIALRIEAQRQATALALTSVENAAKISQTTAEKAVAKAEAAADKALLEQMITAVRHNFGEQIQATRETLQAANNASEKAIIKAEYATEKRFESVNEFRAQLNQQQQTFMPRQESETWHRSHVEKIDAVASRLDKIEGRSSGFASSGAILVAVVSIVGIAVSTVIILALNT